MSLLHFHTTLLLLVVLHISFSHSTSLHHPSLFHFLHLDYFSSGKNVQVVAGALQNFVLTICKYFVPEGTFSFIMPRTTLGKRNRDAIEPGE